MPDAILDFILTEALIRELIIDSTCLLVKSFFIVCTLLGMNNVLFNVHFSIEIRLYISSLSEK